MRVQTHRPVAFAAAAITAVLVVPVATQWSAAQAADSGSLVEDFSYPGAAQILTDDPRINLVRGDGHIVFNKTCAAAATGVGRIDVYPSPGTDPICFDVLANTGHLELKIDAVYEIDARHAMTAGGASATATIQPAGGAATSVTLNTAYSTPVGVGADPDGPPTTLLELTVAAA